MVHHDPDPINARPPAATDDAPINPIVRPTPIVDNPNFVVIPDMSINAQEPPPSAGFGTEFPQNPQKGDMFLRVDYLPTKQYKWNGLKWIEISKDVAYDEAYIKHLIEKLDSGEYDVDLLTAAEQEQISRYLQNGNQPQ